jgi:hypothetical protein
MIHLIVVAMVPLEREAGGAALTSARKTVTSDA